MTLKKPEMIIFDCGGTLIYEPDMNVVNGLDALLKHAVYNRDGLGARDVALYVMELERNIKSRRTDFEPHYHCVQRLLFDYLGIGFDLDPYEMEEILWKNSTPGALMPDVDKMLDFLNESGIRTAVISNISFSGRTLHKFINILLPRNRFEFVMASSDYLLRKPDKLLFDTAVKMARLDPGSIWYCGDNPTNDVYGSSTAGIFPVLYDCPVPGSKPRGPKTSDTPHLRIEGWMELCDAVAGAEA